MIVADRTENQEPGRAWWITHSIGDRRRELLRYGASQWRACLPRSYSWRPLISGKAGNDVLKKVENKLKVTVGTRLACVLTDRRTDDSANTYLSQSRGPRLHRVHPISDRLQSHKICRRLVKGHGQLGRQLRGRNRERDETPPQT
jgi:hypothetical protein